LWSFFKYCAVVARLSTKWASPHPQRDPNRCGFSGSAPNLFYASATAPAQHAGVIFLQTPPGHAVGIAGLLIDLFLIHGAKHVLAAARCSITSQSTKRSGARFFKVPCGSDNPLLNPPSLHRRFQIANSAIFGPQAKS